MRPRLAPFLPLLLALGAGADATTPPEGWGVGVVVETGARGEILPCT